jgi:hypothetical protein
MRHQRARLLVVTSQEQGLLGFFAAVGQLEGLLV